MKTYICLEDFQEFIMNYIQSNDLEEMFKSTIFFNESKSESYFQAMQHGLIWASLLAGAKMPKYYQKGEIKNEYSF